MSGTRLGFGEIKLGSPLPMDVYDRDGKLLLMRGQAVRILPSNSWTFARRVSARMPRGALKSGSPIKAA